MTKLVCHCNYQYH